ncbi:MAG: hypothetical protein Q9222_002571, partial [Ikaeria aurantiellina]
MASVLDDTHIIRLLEWTSGSGLDGRMNYEFKEYSWQNRPAYDVLEYTSTSRHESSSLISFDGEGDTSEPTLTHAFSHWEHRNGSQRLWIQSLCHDPGQTSNSKQVSLLLKRIRTHADKVIIWIGRDHEEDDILRDYLGPGTNSSTESAFKVCESIANVRDPEVDFRQLIVAESPQNRRAKLCYLMNLLYRPWFSELPILAANYLDAIHEIVVRCGTRTIKWVSIKSAAERIRLIEPIPHLLVEDCSVIFQTEERIQDWLQAREAFGFSTLRLLTQTIWLRDQLSKGQGDTEVQNDNVSCFGGFIDELFGMTPEIRKTLSPMIRKYYAEENARGHPAITLASLESLSSSSRPTPPIRGALDPAPDPIHQAPYVYKPLNRGFVRLFVLFPQSHSDDSIIQGTMISRFEDDDEPPFTLVGNSHLKRYRRTSQILVDGQSLLLAEALEVFLRRVRDPIDERIFFIPSICMEPQAANALGAHRGVKALNLYDAVLAMISNISGGLIDLYDVLMEAAEDPDHERDGGLDADDWLLDILDEAVNDTLIDGQAEEGEKPRYTSQYRDVTPPWEEEQPSLKEKTTTYFYDLRRQTNTTSSMDAGADPRTWSISN